MSIDQHILCITCTNRIFCCLTDCNAQSIRLLFGYRDGKISMRCLLISLPRCALSTRKFEHLFLTLFVTKKQQVNDNKFNLQHDHKQTFLPVVIEFVRLWTTALTAISMAATATALVKAYTTYYLNWNMQ